MLGRLVSVLLSQSRFFGDSLVVAAAGPTFSRFFIAPSEDGRATGSALQCAHLGAFGGFMERSFRAHDFLLGRRNCQKFLKSYFRLPMDNPIIAAGQRAARTYAAEIQRRFGCGAPAGVTAPNAAWTPVIPLMGTAYIEIPSPCRGTITQHQIISYCRRGARAARSHQGPAVGRCAGCVAAEAHRGNPVQLADTAVHSWKNQRRSD